MTNLDVIPALTTAANSLTNAMAALNTSSASLTSASSSLTNATVALTNSISDLMNQAALAGSKPIYHCLTLSDIVFLGSVLATFVASVIAEEQDQRLKNGTFGAIAGTTVGGLATLLTQQKALIFMGFFGSVTGALLGWLVACGFSIWAAHSEFGRTVLNYLIGGWKGVVQKLDLEREEFLIEAMSRWEKRFVHRLQKERESVLIAPTNESIAMTMTSCLTATVDVFELLLHIAKRPEYRSRVTIIVYGKKPVPPPPAPAAPAALPAARAPVPAAASGDIVGYHWISYTGTLPAHKRTQEFDNKSVGFQVLTEKLASPYFTTGDKAKSEGQDRGLQKYRPFLTFRLNDCAILALDWPEDLTEDAPFVVEARDFFQEEICPALQALLSRWHGDLEGAVNLTPI
jgi:hypothetical protein